MVIYSETIFKEVFFMKNSGFKKKAISTVLGVIAVSTLSYGAMAQEFPPRVTANSENAMISPYYVAITGTSATLKESESESGTLLLQARTTVRYGNTAEVTIQLQKSSSIGWKKVNEWTKTGTTFANIETSYVPGYGNFRLEVTHRAYDSDGNLLEETVTYSSTVTI